jgi:hypothetical protein
MPVLGRDPSIDGTAKTRTFNRSPWAVAPMPHDSAPAHARSGAPLIIPTTRHAIASLFK